MTAVEFAALYDAQVRTVRTVLFRLCPRSHLDDLTQEVFLRAWRGRDNLRTHSSARAWLCRIARNVAIDALRGGGEKTANPPLEIASEPIAPGLDPDERALVLGAFSALPSDDQLLLILIVVEECTMVEIGEVLGIPAGTVKSRAFALRKQLRDNIEPKQGAA